MTSTLSPEERERILAAARQHTDQVHLTDPAMPVGTEAVPLAKPGWEYQVGQAGHRCQDMMVQCLLAGMQAASNKSVNFDKLKEQEELSWLRTLFLSWLRISGKSLKRWRTAGHQNPIQDLVKLAFKVYNSREEAAEAQRQARLKQKVLEASSSSSTPTKIEEARTREPRLLSLSPGWIEAFPTTRETAEVGATTLLEHIIPRFGLPRTIQSDNGPAFISKLTQQMAAALQITWKLHIPYHPQSSGKSMPQKCPPPYPVISFTYDQTNDACRFTWVETNGGCPYRYCNMHKTILDTKEILWQQPTSSVRLTRSDKYDKSTFFLTIPDPWDLRLLQVSDSCTQMPAKHFHLDLRQL
ncbi:uncharacterized protein [Macaca nemestrina]|uniref:uncharacterized protein n=1 Tax=Macaca nemestrina TaxID=9545 RepID=UPI0039B85312